MQTHRRHVLVVGLSLATVAGLAAGWAAAQTQTGNALQRDLTQDLTRVRTGPGQPATGAYSTSARDIVQEVRLRNAIVTGNAPGGLSFRGNVGYTAPDDFRGSLGSDDTFAFRRDSLPSGVGGIGYRGTESLQYQFAYTTGSSSAPTAYVTRLDGASARLPSPAGGRTDNAGVARANALESGWSTSGANMGTLRSVGAYQSSRLLTPSVIGYRPTFAGVEQTSASPLLGVRTVTLGSGPLSNRGAETPRPNAVSNVVPGTAAGGNAAGSGPASLTAPTNAAPSTSASLPVGVTPAAVKPLPTPGATPGAESPATRDVFGETRDRLRDAVRQRTPGEQPRPGEAMDPQPGTEPDTGPGAAGVPEDPYEARMAKLRAMLDPNQRRRAPLIDPNIPDDELTPEQRAARAAERGDFAGVDEELLAIIRDAKVTTSTLVMDPESKDAIDAQMLRGQRLMGEQRYFDAEEQFARVVSFRPGNTAALIGRAHAQLGAGLFLSSALNLREVFANQPETMAVRYQHPAIPDSDRLRVLIERLRTNLQRGRAMNESALLLAYIGHQIDDAAIRREGIEAMRAVDLGDPLPSVLEAAWTEEK
jgi:hypothetical protein